MKCFVIFFLPLLVHFSAIAQYDFEEWKEDRYAQANTAIDVSYLSAEEKEVIRLINLARLNPSLFAKTYVKAFAAEKKLENHKQVKSLISDLTKAKVLPLYLPDEELTKAARGHAEYMGKQGKMGHKGKGGSDPAKRVEQFVQWDIWIAENIQYGSKTPIDIVLRLLIDEKVPDLGHRKNLLDTRGRYIGVAIAPHKTSLTNCVMDFTGGVLK